MCFDIQLVRGTASVFRFKGLEQDLILYEVAQNFSDVPDYLEIYKRLNKLSCNTAAIKRRLIKPLLKKLIMLSVLQD